MSWKHSLKLGDLPPGEELEITCRHCGQILYFTAADLSDFVMSGALDGEAMSLAEAYLDQVEARFRCRRCGGPGRLSRLLIRQH